jgi:hypothetical protein
VGSLVQNLVEWGNVEQKESRPVKGGRVKWNVNENMCGGVGGGNEQHLVEVEEEELCSLTIPKPEIFCFWFFA